MIPPEIESTDNAADELWSLAEGVCNGSIEAGQYERLNALLSDDEDAARRYATYVRMHGLLLWHWRDADASPATFPVIVATPLPSAVPASLATNWFLPGGYVFSYTLAAFVVGIGLLIGWVCQVPNPRFVRVESVRVAPQLPPKGANPDMVFVGRVTGMVDCQWADPKTGTVGHAYVPLGRTYALASGLMEVTYDSGARVILQGPCTYNVESRTGGYLSLGRLTAKLQRKTKGGNREAEKGELDNVESRHSNSDLFAIRTPTAKITDFGTEFGVEVDESGVSRAHVYQGKVEMRAAGSGNSLSILLTANESARAEVGVRGVVALVRQKCQNRTLVREMPKSAAIALFNTGVGLKGGEADSHWQVAARSDDPKFEPRPAVVRGWRDETFLKDDPGRSQWISLVPGDAMVPQDVVYVFRTTFDLAGVLPSTVVVRGKFMADDRVVAIRLNGRRLPVPAHRDTGPFFEWTSFQISAGFVRGVNSLEFDVLNCIPGQSPSERRNSSSRMSFRAELEGAAARDPRLAGDGDDVGASRTSSKPKAHGPNGDRSEAAGTRRVDARVAEMRSVDAR
jgi:hypothetical protein